MKKIRIEIVNIGTELLRDKVNTNLLSISKFLQQFNLQISRAVNISDDKIELKNALTLAMDNSDIIFTTGGLGPTIDDITKESVSEVVGKKLVFSDEIFAKILAVLKNRGRIVSDELKNNLKNMAYLIDESLVLNNLYGTAPGLVCNIVWKNSRKTIVILPGPPDEMKSILENDFLEYLKTESWLNFKSDIKNIKNVKKLEFQIFGLTESEVDIELRKILNSAEIFGYKNTVEIETAILINSGLIFVGFDIFVEMRLIASLQSDCNKNKSKVDEVCELLNSKMQQIFGDKILAENNFSIQELVVQKLISGKKTIAVAESCTGGLICKMLTDVSGSSDCFVGGIVAYSNEIKIKELAVNKTTIENFGAVSEETAREMAKGVVSKFGTDYAVATTGIAGPKGGSTEKPVGLVHIAIASKIGDTETIKLNFGGDRDTIRQRAATVSLAKLLEILKNRNIKSWDEF